MMAQWVGDGNLNHLGSEGGQQPNSKYKILEK